METDATLLATFAAEELSTGIMPDLPGANPRLFRDGRNVQFADGAVEPILRSLSLFERKIVPGVTYGNGGYGEGGYGGPSSVPDFGPFSGLLDARVFGTSHLFWGSPEHLYTWNTDNPPWEIGQGYTGGATALWSLAKWGSWIVASNGVDPLQVWRGNLFTNLEGDPPRTAAVLVQRSPYLLALNTPRGEEFIQWCSLDDINTWTAAVDNTAGGLPVRDLASGIRAAVGYRGEVMAATAGELIFIRYIGPPGIFGYTKTAPGAGVWGKYSLCVSKGSTLFGFGPRGIWKSDGTAVEYFDDPVLREFVYGNINAGNAYRALAWYNAVDNLVEFYYPTAGSEYSDRGVAINPTTGAWTVLDYGRTAATDSGVFNFAVTADVSQVYYLSAIPAQDRAGHLGFDPTAELSFPYGHLGYGESGYGGETLVG